MSKYLLLLASMMMLLGQHYLWPTESSRVLTSSFAEPRANRFHAGIDISTWNAEGYKCFAIDDAYVYRIWTQPYGYGKALYLKLKDGRIAVYAHLSKYAGKIERYIKGIQKRQKKYNQNIYLKKNQISLKKGDIVAYTGSTGIGTPHFHFEIRKNMNVNEHTLSFYPNFKDKTRPVPLKLYAIALGEESIVNQSVSFATVDFEKRSDSLYQVISPIEITGQAVLAIENIDRTLKRSIPTRVDFTELYVDSEQIFYSHFPETSYSENHYLNLDHHLFFKKVLNKKVKNLSLNPKNKLRRFYHHKNFAVLKNPFDKDTILNFWIKLRDYKKNESVLKGKIHFKAIQLINERLGTEILPPYLSKKAIFFANYTLSKDSTLNFLKLSNLDHFRMNGEEIKTKVWYANRENQYQYHDYRFQVAKNTILEDRKVAAYSLDYADFPKGYHYTSDIVLFNPLDLFFNTYLEVRLNREMKKGEAFYEWNLRKKKWDYIRPLSTNKRSFKTRSVDIYTTLIDSIPPSIYFIDKKYDSRKTIFRIRIRDKLSGIRDEKNYDLRIGREKIIAEYDYEEELLKIDMVDLRKATILSLEVRDNVGNKSIKKQKISK